jgi:hypothetical protein
MRTSGDAAWPGQAWKDATIHAHISTIRKAFSTFKPGSDYIDNFQGGYKFTGPVESVRLQPGRTRPGIRDTHFEALLSLAKDIQTAYTKPRFPYRQNKPFVPLRFGPRTKDLLIGRIVSEIRPGRSIAILGDYGQGKTVACAEIAFRLATEFVEAPRPAEANCLPIILHQPTCSTSRSSRRRCACYSTWASSRAIYSCCGAKTACSHGGR